MKHLFLSAALFCGLLISGTFAKAQTGTIFDGLAKDDEKSISCDTLVVTDVEAERMNPKPGGQLTIVAFDLEACKKMVKPLSWRDIVESFKTNSLSAPMFSKILEGKQSPVEKSPEQIMEDFKRRLEETKPRSSQYWQLIAPMAEFCKSLGVAAEGYLRSCNFGAYDIKSSIQTRALILASIAGIDECCAFEPLQKSSVSSSLQSFFSAMQNNIRYSEISAALSKDGFDCKIGEEFDSCKKNYLTVHLYTNFVSEIAESLQIGIDSIPMYQLIFADNEAVLYKLKKISNDDLSPYYIEDLKNAGVGIGRIYRVGAALAEIRYWNLVLMNDIFPLQN